MCVCTRVGASEKLEREKENLERTLREKSLRAVG
jgi:hypothetical protein